MHLFQTETPQVELLLQERARLKAASLAQNTIRGYAYDWSLFTRWCEAAGKSSLPASTETISLYVTSVLSAGKKVSTASRRVCAIAHQHRTADLECPTNEIYQLLSCAQRLRAEKPRQMRPLTVEQLRLVSRTLRAKGTKMASRDRAIIVLGFSTALRRSSLAALDIEDLEFRPEGLIVTVRKEKQDQLGIGRYIGVPSGQDEDTDAVRCVRQWIEIRGRQPGPLFWRMGQHRKSQPLDGDCLLRTVKIAIAAAGIDATDYGARSLRAGFVTEAAENGVSDLLIAAQTGHRSMVVLHKYFRRTRLFKSNPCSMMGL